MSTNLPLLHLYNFITTQPIIFPPPSLSLQFLSRTSNFISDSSHSLEIFIWVTSLTSIDSHSHSQASIFSFFFMDKEYFFNAGIPPALHFEPSMAGSPMPGWQSLPSSDYFLNPSWENSADQQHTPFESAMSSMVSSPAAANSAVNGDSFAIRELIGKLGTICSSGGELSPPFLAATAAYNASTNTSCYSTPLNSPPKLRVPIMDQFVKENLPNLRNPMVSSSALPALPTDPGFAERAAKFSCFGSRSFNGRTNQFGPNNTEIQCRSNTPPLPVNMKLSRVSSSPSLKADGSQLGNKNSQQSQMEMGSSYNLPVSGSDKKLSKLSGHSASCNEESSVSEQNPCRETGSKAMNDSSSRKRKPVSKGKSKENSPIPSANGSKGTECGGNSNAKRLKTAEIRTENGGVETEDQKKRGNRGTGDDDGEDDDDEKAKAKSKAAEPPKDYIHVRARRGQATDSHSLAERVRREKISERMKLLQDLVPGCNKVTGKALMLDEIINYVQSLQHQVEFLSMKLASVNPKLELNMDNLLSKDIFQTNSSLPQPIYPLDSSALYGHHQQQNPQLHSSVDAFGANLPQFPSFCEDDLQSIVQMGFAQNSHQNSAFPSQGFSGPSQTSHMKVEL